MYVKETGHETPFNLTVEKVEHIKQKSKHNIDSWEFSFSQVSKKNDFITKISKTKAISKLVTYKFL